METLVPANLRQSNRVARFLGTNFSRSEAILLPEPTHLKLPLSIGVAEFHGYTADLPSGGFGPFYGALLLLGVAGAVVATRTATSKASAAILFSIACALLFTIFAHGQAWWARYVPQAWLLPLLAIIALLSAPRRSARWVLGMGMACLAAANVLIVEANTARLQWLSIRANRRAVAELRAVNTPVSVYLDSFVSLRQRLHEAGVAFTVATHPPDASVVRHTIPSPASRAFWFERRAE
jgi:hypothetical protein